MRRALVASVAVLLAFPAAARADHVSVALHVSARLGDRLSDNTWLVVVDWNIDCTGPAPGQANYTGNLYLDEYDTGDSVSGGSTSSASGSDTFPVERRARPRTMTSRIQAACFDSGPGNHGSGTYGATGNAVRVPAKGDEDGDGVIDARPSPPPGGGGPTAPPSGRCAVEKLGTSAADTLLGTSAGDRILGLAGDDFLRGLDGDDCLVGGPGFDRLSGGTGNDRMEGGDATDRLDGDGGDDRLIGGDDPDGLSGRSGDDNLAGSGGGDRLVGAVGDDRLSGGGGNDSISGGVGRDRLFGGAGADRLLGGPGRNRYSAGAGNDVVDARNRRAEVVSCGAGRDRARVDRSDTVRGCERFRRG